MKFTHDFQQDLQTILAELDSGRSFAFNRFADGELAILEKRDIPTADGWNSVNVSDQFRERLLAALRYRHPDYYVGIDCPCCNRAEWERLMKLAGREPDDPQVTFSNVFVNGNYETVCSKMYVPTTALFNPGTNMVNIDDEMLRVPITTARKYLEIATKPLFIAAGPATKIIIHELWSTGSQRVPLIDIGSVVDTNRTRGYHDPNHPNRKKICRWAEDAPASLDLPPTHPWRSDPEMWHDRNIYSCEYDGECKAAGYGGPCWGIVRCIGEVDLDGEWDHEIRCYAHDNDNQWVRDSYVPLTPESLRKYLDHLADVMK